MPKLIFSYKYTADWVLDRAVNLFAANPRVKVIIRRSGLPNAGTLKVKVPTKKELADAHRLMMADEVLSDYFADPEVKT